MVLQTEIQFNKQINSRKYKKQKIHPIITPLGYKRLCLLACEQALCLGKNSEEREGKGGREPVDKHLRPLFRHLVIILPIICQ